MQVPTAFPALVIPYIITTLVMGVIGIFTWRYRKEVIGQIAFAIILITTLSSLFCTLSLVVADPSINIALISLQIPLRLTPPALLFLFIIAYTQGTRWINLRFLLVVLIEPALAILVAWTNPLHSLFVSTPSIGEVAGITTYVYTPGPAFWFHTIFSYTLIIAGTTLMIFQFISSHEVYRRQIALVLGAFIAPSLAHFIVLFLSGGFLTIEITPLVFCVTAIGIFIATSRYRLFTLTPVAFHTLFSKLPDGVIVLNAESLILDANPAALGILGKTADAIIGQKVSDIIPELEVEPGLWSGGVCLLEAVALQKEVNPHYYDFRSIPLDYDKQERSGDILLIHDSHAQHLYQTGLMRANEKLQLLTSITRHDLLNTLAAHQGFMQLAREGRTDEQRAFYLEKAMAFSGVLQNQIEFTRDYQGLGLNSAVWQDVHAVFTREAHLVFPQGIQTASCVKGLFIYADPLFERVIYNLLENSRRHGETISEVQIHAQTDKEKLVLVYEDDGAGIPVEEKEKIFQRGYGNGTGLGLFLTREILAITGITITESGIPGHGAKFCMTIPSGAFRWEMLAGSSDCSRQPHESP